VSTIKLELTKEEFWMLFIAFASDRKDPEEGSDLERIEFSLMAKLMAADCDEAALGRILGCVLRSWWAEPEGTARKRQVRKLGSAIQSELVRKLREREAS